MVAAPVIAGDTKFITGDDTDYYGIAISLVTNGSFTLHGHPTAYRMPFFPLFLAFWHLLFGIAPYAILPILLVIGGLLPVGTYLLARTLGGSTWIALVAAMITAIDNYFVIFSRLYMTEVLFSLLVVTSMLAVSRLRTTYDWVWAGVAGTLLGAATLTRANFGPFVVIVLLWLVWHGRNKLRVVLPQTALVGMIVGAMWGGWVVRNYMVFHCLIPFTTQGGNAYYGIYNDQATADDIGDRFGYWIWRIPDPPATPGKVWDEVALDQYQRTVTREWIAAHPGKALRAALMQVFHLWRPSFDASINYLLTVVIGLPALIGLAFYRRQPDIVLWLWFTVTMSALTITSAGMERYQLPLRPILAVTAVLSMTSLAQRLVRRSR